MSFSVCPRTCSTLVRVRYGETDTMGVAYYANYLVWFEVGRTEWLRQLGWTYREMEAEGLFLPVVEARCEYRRPARYDDELEVRTRGSVVSGARVRFEYEVVRTSDKMLVAAGETIHAVLNGDGRPRRLPERVRSLFEERP